MRFFPHLRSFAVAFLTVVTIAPSMAAAPGGARAIGAGSADGRVAPVSVMRPASVATTREVLAKSVDLAAFNHLLGLTNMSFMLKRAKTSYTVFAPTKEAVMRVPAHIRSRLFTDGHPLLRHIVRTHMVEGVVDLTKLADGAELKTLDGEVIRVAKKADGSILLNGVYRVSAAQPTANGMVYTIDSMIAPAQ